MNGLIWRGARHLWDALRTLSTLLILLTLVVGSYVISAEGRYRVADATPAEASEAHEVLDEIVAEAVRQLLDGYPIVLNSNLLLSRGQVWPISYTHVALLRSLESAVEGKPTAWIMLLESRAVKVDPRDPVGPLTIRALSLGLERWHAAGLSPSVQMYRILSFSSLASSAISSLDAHEGMRAGRSDGICTAAPYVPQCIYRFAASALEQRSLRQRAREAHLLEHQDWASPAVPKVISTPPDSESARDSAI